MYRASVYILEWVEGALDYDMSIVNGELLHICERWFSFGFDIYGDGDDDDDVRGV